MKVETFYVLNILSNLNALNELKDLNRKEQTN